MVSAIRPEAPRIKYPNRSGLGTRGNKQRLTKDVTPLPRLEDLRQGLRMPDHALYSTLGYPPGQPVSTSLAGTPQGRPAYSSNSCKVQVSVCPNIKGKTRGITVTMVTMTLH